MITIYAEKFDVASKIAASLGGFNYNGTNITMENISQYKTKIDKDVKKNGFIPIKYNGEDYAVTWGQGHMCTLYQGYDYNDEYQSWYKIPLPLIPENYQIKIRDGYDFKARKPLKTPDKWAKNQLNLIKKLFNQSEYIINATDDDREGELIFSYVYEFVKCNKPYKRMVIDSQTKEGLIKAFNNLKPSSSVINVENAGRARAISDWVVGTNLTAKMTLKYNRAMKDIKMITVGRVQTVILDFIVTREKAIQNFKPEPFWYVVGKFSKDKESYLGKHKDQQIFEKKVAEDLFNKVNGKKGEVVKKESKPFKKQVPLLYNLPNLSKDMNKIYGFTAAKTLKLCQSLYEKGFLTYPRTESTYLTNDMMPEVDRVLDMLSNYKDNYKQIIDMVNKSERNYTNRHFNSSKVDSHFAIIPTHEAPHGMTDPESKLYDIVARSLIKIIFKEAQGFRTNITTQVEGEDFFTSGTIISDPQWMSANVRTREDDILPDVKLGDIVDGKYELKEGTTKPPARYTDASLLLAMQTASKEIEDNKLKEILEKSNKGGIGRPSTQANLIESVVTRYCTRKGKTIVPTEDGMKIIEILPVNDLKSPEMTAKWEEDLDKIENGQLLKDDFIHDIEKSVVEWCKEIDRAKPLENAPNPNVKQTDLICPVCKKPLIEYDKGYGCSGFEKDNPDSCKFFVNKSVFGGKRKIKKILEDLQENGRTKETFLIKNPKTKKEFRAFLVLKNQNISFDFETNLSCPKCGEKLRMNTKAVSCPNRDFVVWFTPYGEKKEKTWEEIVKEINNKK